MQGVDQFGDYGIQIRLKMMTKPGEQFVIRRRALALIKKPSTRTASGLPSRPSRWQAMRRSVRSRRIRPSSSSTRLRPRHEGRVEWAASSPIETWTTCTFPLAG